MLLTAVKTGVDYTCGGLGNFVFDGQLPLIISTIITIIEFGVPIILIIYGMLDLGRAVMAQKEDEIKRDNKHSLKDYFFFAIVFFVIFIVKIVIGLVAPSNDTSIVNCINCFTQGTTDTCSAK